MKSPQTTTYSTRTRSVAVPSKLFRYKTWYGSTKVLSYKVRVVNVPSNIKIQVRKVSNTLRAHAHVCVLLARDTISGSTLSIFEGTEVPIYLRIGYDMIIK